MSEFVHHHELALMLVMCALVGVFTWHYEKWKDRKALFESEPRHIWQCVQFGGGASLYTPRPMTREDAVEWASKAGSVAYVDTQHHKIFYRARS
jgi:hypothetical protein